MTRAYAAFHRYAPGITSTCYLACVWLLATTACAPVPGRAAQIELLAELPNADRRSGGNPAEAIRVELAGPSGDLRPSISLQAPARVTWAFYLPPRAIWQSALWGSGQVRVGLSNGRSYHEVVRQQATASWAPLRVDLSEYSEWKFSVFYQPLRTEWQLIINADATTPDGDNRLALDRPLLKSSTSR